MESTRNNPLFDKRLIIGLMLTIGVAASFWLGSRYPDLNEKGAIGVQRDLQGIAFDIVLPVSPDDPAWKKIVFTTVNWMQTNKKGMAFGLVFASCLMTVLGFIEKGRIEGLFANTFKGFLIGAPMGLCVNCAAPVAYGLKKGGARPETALGAMLSSPSMNVVVIGMMFSLLPWYLAALKLGFSLLLVFGFVPLLVRLAPASWMTPRTDVADTCSIDAVCDLSSETTPPTNWGEALGWTAKTFFGNLWRLGKQTVPLMILAGLLGSTLITFLPFDVIQSINDLGAGDQRIWAMVGLAIFGVFLPVPMAFDVVLVAMLLGLGIPVSFAMVLLFTLGSYSFYSYLIVARAFSHMTAGIITGAVVAVALLAGVLAPPLRQLDQDMHRRLLDAHFRTSTPIERNIPEVIAARPWTEIEAALKTAAKPFEPFSDFRAETPGSGEIKISVQSQKRTSGAGKLFTRSPGEKWGIEQPSHFSLRKFAIFHHQFVRGLASGDVHGDNYPDVLVCGDADVGGLYLYANLGGKRFVRQELDLGPFNRKSVLSAAMIDFNDDGWLDIIFTTLNDGNFLYLNTQGQFVPGRMYPLSHRPGTSAVGVGFHDFDGNGRLDMFLGNYSIGHVARRMPISHESSRNQILFVNGPGPDGLQLTDLPAVPGETHGVLATDFNRDGRADFMCYNDWFAPDILYLSSPNGQFRKATPADGVIPITTESTMSIQAADIDNDLVQEFYLSQISGSEKVGGRHNIRISLDEYERTAATIEERESMREFREKYRAYRNENFALTYHVIPKALRQDWMAYHVIRSMVDDPTRDFLSLTPEHREDVRMFVSRIQSPYIMMENRDYPDQIPQYRGMDNVFLVRNEAGALTNRAHGYGLERAGWTWHAGFADLDHDEFQDLYVATGWIESNTRDNNTFFSNEGGKRFELKTDEFGLSDYAVTSAFNYVDFDRDGDLDVLSLPVTFASLRVFENQGPIGNSLTIQLRDHLGNRFGVGSRIIIRYGENSAKHQLREIRASGGFISFDPQEAHFGIGEFSEIAALEVHWPNGELTKLEGPFPANNCFRIERLD